MINLLKIIKLGLLVYGMSTVWEDTHGCENQYLCSLTIYLMTVVSYLSGIIVDNEINAPVHVNNVGDGLNTTDKLYLKE